MKLRTTLVLAGVLTVLSLAYYFLELQEARKEAETKLVSFEEDAVTALTIRRGKNSITLTKGEGGWRMSQPVEDRGDKKEITALLANVTGATIERTLEAPGGPLGDFGLQDPAVVLTLHLRETERPFTLEFGSQTPAGLSVYARRRGEQKILIAPGTLKAFLEKKPSVFRSKVPLFFEQNKVTALMVRTDLLRFRLEHEKETWRFTDPIEATADAGKVGNLIRSLTQDQVRAFLDRPPTNLKSLGLDPPRGEIRLTLKGGGEVTLLLGARKKAGSVYARRGGEDHVLELKKAFVKNLPHKVADLRDRTLLALDRDKVQQIALTSLKGRTRLQKVEGRWRITEPEEALADHQLIEDLLWDLAGARVKEFVTDNATTLKPYGLDAPAVTIRLLDQHGKSLTSLALNRAKKRKGAYARVGNSHGVSLVDASLYEQLAKGPFDLRFRQLFTFETWDVGKMELSRDGEEIIVEKRKDRFELKKPREGKAKYSAVMDLLNDIKNLKWQKVVAREPSVLPRYGLAEPVASLTLTKTDGTLIGSLLLGKAEGKVLYAKRQDRPEIYAVPSTFLSSIPKDPSTLLE
ncbi:MAG: DUF4340 domain-containing protein [Candidatus Methylomirabilales bacterium]